MKIAIYLTWGFAQTLFLLSGQGVRKKGFVYLFTPYLYYTITHLLHFLSAYRRHEAYVPNIRMGTGGCQAWKGNKKKMMRDYSLGVHMVAHSTGKRFSRT